MFRAVPLGVTGILKRKGLYLVKSRIDGITSSFFRRVDWSSAEDSFLLLCKVASCFLFPNKRSQMITFSLVRDLLHERFPEARNKTSRACQRRINYIMKNPTTEDNVAIFLEEVKQDQKIVKDFKVYIYVPYIYAC